MNAYYAEFVPTPAEQVRLHQHPGGEFIYVLAGTLRVNVGGDEHTLEARDSMYFDSGVPHGYRKAGAKPCCAIVVTTAWSHDDQLRAHRSRRSHCVDVCDEG